MSEKPEWIKDEYGPNYGDIVGSWGLDVLQDESFGSYQGDLVYLLGDGERRGLLIVGYGSCSGCDHLQAITPWGYDYLESDEAEALDWSQVEAFREQLRNDIHWEDSITRLRDWYVQASENKLGDWWLYDDEANNFIRTVLGLQPVDADA